MSGPRVLVEAGGSLAGWRHPAVRPGARDYGAGELGRLQQRGEVQPQCHPEVSPQSSDMVGHFSS